MTKRKLICDEAAAARYREELDDHNLQAAIDDDAREHIAITPALNAALIKLRDAEIELEAMPHARPRTKALRARLAVAERRNDLREELAEILRRPVKAKTAEMRALEKLSPAQRELRQWGNTSSRRGEW